MRLLPAVLFMALPVLAFSTLARAYSSAQVGPSGAIIFSQPQSNAAMSGTLRAGQTVTITEPAHGGYFHVSVGPKYLGWVQETALIVTSLPAAEERHEPPKSYLGVFAGDGMVSGGGGALGLGVDGGYKLSPLWGLGIYFEYMNLASAAAVASTAMSGSTSAASTATGGASLLLAAAEFNFYLPRLTGLYVGAKAGLGIVTASGSTTPTSSTTPASNTTAVPTSSGNASSFALGGALSAGYDYALFPTVSIGAEANYFFVSGDIATKITNLLAAVKYIF